MTTTRRIEKMIQVLKNRQPDLTVVCNFTPVPRKDYRAGAPHDGYWKEVLNSDAALYGGSGSGNLGGMKTTPIPFHNQPCSLVLTLPPLAALFFRSERKA